MKKLFGQEGFTLIELLLVMALFAILTSMVGINFLTPQANSSLSSISLQLKSDLRNQQINAMQGESSGQSSAQYQGIHFEQDHYVIFHGGTFSLNNNSNFIVNLDPNLNFINIGFNNGDLVFNPLSGEVNNFDPNKNTVTLQELNSGKQTVLTINRYGVITD